MLAYQHPSSTFVFSLSPGVSNPKSTSRLIPRGSLKLLFQAKLNIGLLKFSVPLDVSTLYHCWSRRKLNCGDHNPIVGDKVKPTFVSNNGFTSGWQLVAVSGREWHHYIFRSIPFDCRQYKEKPSPTDSSQLATSWWHLSLMWWPVAFLKTPINELLLKFIYNHVLTKQFVY